MERDEAVVLLHGLGRGPASMATMAQVLRAAGYHVVNQAYASRKDRIEVLAEEAVTPAVAACGDARVHFIGHSMGAILTRYWLQNHSPPDMGRVVMLGPPNKGSALVDTFADLKPFEWINGPAGLQLTTDEGSVPNRLGAVGYEVGVIAGTQSLNPIYSALIGKENDGKVAVEDTHVEGMQAHLVLPVTHTFMMMNPLVIAQVVTFLQSGRFETDLTLPRAVERLANIVGAPTLFN